MTGRLAHPLLFLLVLVGALSLARAVEAGTFLDGKRYLALPDAERLYYVVGLSDMMDRMSKAVDNSTEKAFLARAARCTQGMNGSQLRQFIDNFMHADPKTGQYSMASNYRAALNLRCPR
jgi:hypothetical protein